MSSDKQQAVYGLVFGLASVVVALLALLVAVLQLLSMRQAYTRVPTFRLERMRT